MAFPYSSSEPVSPPGTSSLYDDPAFLTGCISPLRLYKNSESPPRTPPLLGTVYDDPAFLAGYESPIPDEPAQASRSVAKSPSLSESVPDDSMGYPDTPDTPDTTISSAPSVTHSTEQSTASISGRKTRAADKVCLVTGLLRLLTRSWTRPDPTAVSHARRPLHAVRGLLIVCDG